MKNKMIEQLRNVMPNGMQNPKEIEALYQYVEDNQHPYGFRLHIVMRAGG